MFVLLFLIISLATRMQILGCSKSEKGVKVKVIFKDKTSIECSFLSWPLFYQLARNSSSSLAESRSSEVVSTSSSTIARSHQSTILVNNGSLTIGPELQASCSSKQFFFLKFNVKVLPHFKGYIVWQGRSKNLSVMPIRSFCSLSNPFSAIEMSYTCNALNKAKCIKCQNFSKKMSFHYLIPNPLYHDCWRYLYLEVSSPTLLSKLYISMPINKMVILVQN